MDFDQIYKSYSTKIFRICLGYFNDYELAKDITQETFIAVWTNLSKFQNRSSIGTWIYRIATNKCLREIQKEKSQPRTGLPSDLTVMEPSLEKEEKLSRLNQYISELPELERIIITLSLENVPQEEIAEIIGISHSNARVKFHRIKAKLTKKFKENG
ncbi:RNA polymerase sigma factor [Brumimicrobium aurantiacum]|uniref:Sigma-70 family RNA polymerase sigma factor n=1 Tax=Brumimicrobium aurantiacum TaxID=1737063 RepID=A0A3E1EXT7_9FLAO|nr:sigma-70 family RNA polymerase sigma factor [Brumimicrobium aurantiacum]RFC54273.1 sigma-70 family RNA polymerase sigma factor [Brumimicrobium aurantiacum]